MAIKLSANYSKKLGLPQFSSHSFSASVEVELELSDTTKAEAEVQKLYQLLQHSVDQEIQHPGFFPGSNGNSNGRAQSQSNGNGRSYPLQPNGRSSHDSNGHSQPRAAGDAWNCTDGLTQRMTPRGFAHEELLRVEFDQMRFVRGAAIGAVGEHCLVFVIEQLLKHLAVVDAGGRGAGAEDELGFQVVFYMVLPAVVRFVVLLGPACLAVLLAARGVVGIELLESLALLDALVLLAVVALARGFDSRA